MKPVIRFVLALAAIAALCLPAFAQDAFTNRSTELKDRAAADARTVATLAENAPVKVLVRSGGWTQVDASGQKGWVRAFHLRFPAPVETSSASSSGGGAFLSGLTGALGIGKPAAQEAKLASTGVRGLSPEDLKNANPDAAALAKAQSYRADKPAAERFAREGKLDSVSVDEGGRR